MKAVLLLVFVHVAASVRYVPYSPCPDLFGYFESQTWEVFGAFTVENDLSGDYNLLVKMSIPTDTDKKLTVRRVTGDEDISNGKGIEYYVGFPFNHTWPLLTEITFNGKTLCTGPPATATSDHGVTELQIDHHSKVTIKPSVLEKKSKKTVGRSKFPVPDKFTTNCGETEGTTPLLFFANPTKSGEYPWLVAIVYYEESMAQYQFRCAGTLVTDKFVITAAHCVKYQGIIIGKDLLTLVLGKHNIKTWARRSVLRDVERIHVHPDYKIPSDADIAVLEMSLPVSFTVTIKPICLWSETEEIEAVVGSDGTVAGWGKDEFNNDYIEEARQLVMPVVSNERCLRKDVRFTKLTSNRTFCAGRADGSGPCTGDSGGGFYLKRNGRWTIRGIVSAGIVDSARKTCDLKQYVVFSDVAQYLGWIISIIE